MYKKTIEYTDYNGNQRKEDFYFNLNKAEIMEMQLSEQGGLDERIKRIIEAQDQPEIIQVFKDLILKAYGEKSPDGKYFDKSHEISRRFSRTEAYSELFMELATNVPSAIEFVNGITPSEQKVTAEDVANSVAANNNLPENYSEPSND
mgnify:FL=1